MLWGRPLLLVLVMVVAVTDLITTTYEHTCSRVADFGGNTFERTNTYTLLMDGPDWKTPSIVARRTSRRSVSTILCTGTVYNSRSIEMFCTPSM